MRCAIWYHLYNLKNVTNTHYLFILYLMLTILQLKISVPQKYTKKE